MNILSKWGDKAAGLVGFVRLDTVKNLVSQYFTADGSRAALPEWEYSRLVEAYKSWVYTCIDKIAKSVAMIPLNLYVYRRTSGSKAIRGERLREVPWISQYKALSTIDRKYFLKELGVKREQVYDHPFLTLVNRPNGIMTRMMLWYETLIRLELGGMCCWFIAATNTLRVPAEIWPLPLTKFARITPKVKEDMTIEYWAYRDGNVDRRFPPNQIIPLRYPNPSSPFQGMSALMAQTYPYDIDLFLMQQQRALFQNMAVPGLHLTTDQKLAPELVKEIQMQINEQYATAIRSGKTLVTHSGLKSDKTGFSGREAVIDKVEKFARDKLITAFDLSPGKIGLVEDVNRANMEALDKTFVNECLKPKTMLVEESLEMFLLPLYDEGLTCDFDLPDTEDKEFRLRERESNLTTGYRSINQERERNGEEPVPWGEAPWLPFTVAQPGTTPPAPAPPPPSKYYDEDDKKMDGAYWTEERKTASWKVFAGRTEALERIIVAPVRKYFSEQGNDVVRRLYAQGKGVEGTYAGWHRSKVERHVGSNKALDDININKAEEVKRIRALVEPLVKAVMMEYGNARMADLSRMKAAGTFNPNTPTITKWLGSRMDQFSAEVTDVSFDTIKAILREGFTEGHPLSTIAETLKQKFESWDQFRAPLIARTETIAASNEADLESVRQAELEDKLKKHWLSARDAACRDTHLEADKRYAQSGLGIDESFHVGRDEMQSPGNGERPEENINCRCTLWYTEEE